jgi:hypothetical protein
MIASFDTNDLCLKCMLLIKDVLIIISVSITNDRMHGVTPIAESPTESCETPLKMKDMTLCDMMR